MQEMNGIQLLQAIDREIDIPVVLFSTELRPDLVLKAIENGACDCIDKPSSMNQLKNIWQHVFRRKLLLGNKRKRDEDANNNSNNSEKTPKKKIRVKWTHDLHEKFIFALNQIGLDVAGPKKILDLMNIPNLKKEHIASHLQKFRKHVKEHGVIDWSKISMEMLEKHAQNQKSLAIASTQTPILHPQSSFRQFTYQTAQTSLPHNVNFQTRPQEQWNFQPPIPYVVPQQPITDFLKQNNTPVACHENIPEPIMQSPKFAGANNVSIMSRAENVSAPEVQNPNLMGWNNAPILSRVDNTSGPIGQNPVSMELNNYPTMSWAENSSELIVQNPNYMRQNNSSIETRVENISVPIVRNHSLLGQNYTPLVSQAENLSAAIVQNPDFMAENNTSMMSMAENISCPIVQSLNYVQQYNAPIASCAENISVPIVQKPNYLRQNSAPNVCWADNISTPIEHNPNYMGQDFSIQGFSGVEMMQNYPFSGTVDECMGFSDQGQIDFNFGESIGVGAQEMDVSEGNDDFISELLEILGDGRDSNK